MFGGVVYIMVPVHPQKGESAKVCEQKSEAVGALSYDEFGTACWNVYGKAVQINPFEHSIEEGFRITNFNFNASGKVAPASRATDLQGPTGFNDFSGSGTGNLG